VKAYPNPVQKSVNIAITLAQNDYYTIGLYNSYGQLVNIIDKGNKTSGSYNYVVSTSDLVNGTYFVVVSNNSKPISRAAIIKQ